MKRLEDALSCLLIPTLTGQSPPLNSNREIFSLPARLGGLGIRNPSSQASFEFSASQRVCHLIVSRILAGKVEYEYECICLHAVVKPDIRRERMEKEKEIRDGLLQSLPAETSRMLRIAGEKGVSSWLTCLPIQEFGYCLHKRAFLDALCLRYGWLPRDVPTKCICGTNFSVDHALSCTKGGFPSLRHNEIQDFTAQVLTEVCNDVLIEPQLQRLSGESLQGGSVNTSEGARLDIAMNGFWGGHFERSFIDVRVFNPHAPSYRNQNMDSCYMRHEKEKKKDL